MATQQAAKNKGNKKKTRTHLSESMLVAHADRTARRGKARLAKHTARIAKRRADGKRNAYLEGRNGRGHRKPGQVKGPVRYPRTSLAYTGPAENKA